MTVCDALTDSGVPVCTGSPLAALLSRGLLLRLDAIGLVDSLVRWHPAPRAIGGIIERPHTQVRASCVQVVVPTDSQLGTRHRDLQQRIPEVHVPRVNITTKR